MSDSKSQLREAVKLLYEYQGVLAQQIAEEIMENKEDFGSPFGQAQNILTKYATQIYELGEVYRVLRGEAWVEEDKPQGRETLARDEFRCFGCGEVIEAKDSACKLWVDLEVTIP